MTPLAREARVFSRYLLGEVAGDDILSLYALAVETGTAGPCPEPRRFDRLLTAIGRVHPASTRAVDVYARHFSPAAPVRKRLILMLAILESHAAPYGALDAVDGGGRPIIYLRLLGAALTSAVLLAVATLVLTPLRVALAGRRSEA